jgi:hypothetical protein
MSDDAILDVDTLRAPTISSQLEIEASYAVFVLLPGEFVDLVDAELGEKLCGLRLRTNLRVSPSYDHHCSQH